MYVYLGTPTTSAVSFGGTSTLATTTPGNFIYQTA